MTDQIKTDNKEIVYVPAYPGTMMQPEDDEIDLLQLWQVIWDAKVFIAGFTLTAPSWPFSTHSLSCR